MDEAAPVPTRWRWWILIAAPALGVAIAWLLPSGIGDPVVSLSHEARVVVALAVTMAIWWLTEAAPMEVTSLLPVVVLPVSRSVPIDKVLAPYASEQVALFFAGFLLSIAIEKWGVHRRFALSILARTGASGPRLVAGLMIATALISSVVSNTATTLMMLPIAIGAAHALGTSTAEDRLIAERSILGVAFAASIGGLATLIGTPPNAIFAGFVSRVVGRDVSFARWLMVGLPCVILLLPMAWWILTRRMGRAASPDAARTIRDQRSVLGRVSWPEFVAAGVFAMAGLCWVLREPLGRVLGLVRARENGSTENLLTDAAIGITAACALFLIPSRRADRPRILEWRDASRVPWGVLLLFGGGLSLSGAISATKVDLYVGAALPGLGVLPTPLLIAAVVAVVVALSEVASNVAAAATVLPIVYAAEQRFGLPTGTLLVPAALAASGGFMLPVATPPNAIAYGTGLVRVRSMYRAGFWLDVAAVVVITTVGSLLATRVIV